MEDAPLSTQGPASLEQAGCSAGCSQGHRQGSAMGQAGRSCGAVPLPSSPPPAGRAPEGGSTWAGEVRRKPCAVSCTAGGSPDAEASSSRRRRAGALAAAASEPEIEFHVCRFPLQRKSDTVLKNPTGRMYFPYFSLKRVCFISYHRPLCPLLRAQTDAETASPETRLLSSLPSVPRPCRAPGPAPQAAPCSSLGIKSLLQQRVP